MKKNLTYLLLSSLAVLGACASTTEMDPDGQTHWMTRCDENADCGELSCICGVCTELCTASDECSTDRASCESASDVLDATECTTRQASSSVCVPLCDGQSECEGVASDLLCSNSGVCGISDRPINEDDGSVADDDDASVQEAAPSVPIELACDEAGEIIGEGPFEVLASAENVGSLAIAPDGTVFGAAFIDSVYGNAFQLVDGEVEGFGMELWDIQGMIIDGDRMIISRTDGWEITISQIDLETGDKLTLAIEDGNNALGMAIDDDAVYWITDVEQDPYRCELWRSPRVPGESLLLGTLDGYASELVAVNDDLFFFATVDGSYDLMRVAKDGSSSSLLDGNQVPENAGRLRTDGDQLFFALHDEMDDLGNPIPGERGIVRMDPVTLDYEMVLSSGEDQPAQMILGGPYVYWTTDHTTQDFEPIIKLWRGAKNGSGAPQQLGTIEAYTDTFAEHGGELYWISTCRIGNDGTTKSHIVRSLIEGEAL